MLQSSIQSVYPLGKIDLPTELLRAEVPREALQQKIEHLRQNYQEIRPVTSPAKKGDFITVSCGEERYTLNTARDIFREELVKICLGHCAGERVASADGGTWDIGSVKRRILPEFDDALVRRLAMEGVDTTEDYVRHLRAKLMKSMERTLLEQAADFLVKEQTKRSEFVLELPEVEAQEAELWAEFSEMARREEVALGELLPELLPMFGLNPKDVSGSEKEILNVIAKQILKTILLGNHYLARYGVELDKAHYERELERIAREEGILAGEAGERLSFFSFLYDKCGAQTMTAARKYLRNNVEFQITCGW